MGWASRCGLTYAGAILLSVVVAVGVTSVVGAEQQRLPSQGGTGTTIANVAIVSATTLTPTAQNRYVFADTVSCPSGQTAIGGGAELVDSNQAPTAGGGMLTLNAPVGNPPTGWTAAGSAGVSASGYNQAAGLTVYATCAQLPTVFLPYVNNGAKP